MQVLQNCICPIIRISRESWCLPYAVFSKNRPLGRFFHRVDMSVCPLPMQFFCVQELVHASLVRELVHASVALAWSPKNGEVFRIGRVTPPSP